jgi:glycosyltransferase involved in cell wall biosynthesis
MISVSIIIPTFNEEATIVELLKKVSAQSHEGIEFKVIVIDDGSTDNTPNLLESHSNLIQQMIKLPSNQGKGAAVKAGLQKARGDYILFQDADLEYDPSDYGALMRPLLTFQSDIVMGSRLIAPQFTRVHYFWHKIGNTLITLLFNILYNTTYTDVYSCYLLYRRELIDPNALRTTGWQQHAEILAKATKKAKVIYEVPISYHGRSYFEGKKIKAFHVIAIFWTIIRERF